MPVKELKSILKSRNNTIYGVKNQLILRLIESDIGLKLAEDSSVIEKGPWICSSKELDKFARKIGWDEHTQ